MVTKHPIGQINGADVFEFNITDGNLSVNIMEYGATVHGIRFYGVECVSGYDTLDGYIHGNSYQGATVGRVANRIKNAKFTLDGKEYRLDANNNGNCLHGGYDGFAFKVYKGEKKSENSVAFTLFSPDGEGGFPGNVEVTVLFTVKNDTLAISYDAVSDKKTPLNFTSHAYFTLGAESCLDTELKINADRITEFGENMIVNGEYMSVDGTPLDFRTPKKIGRDIHSDHKQMQIAGGYDHNFVIGTDCQFRKDVAAAYCPETGITLRVSTDRPGIQLYTSNFLDEQNGKGGKPLTHHSAFCLETQLFPDSPNNPQFPTCIIQPGEHFKAVTEYKFERQER